MPRAFIEIISNVFKQAAKYVFIFLNIYRDIGLILRHFRITIFHDWMTLFIFRNQWFLGSWVVEINARLTIWYFFDPTQPQQPPMPWWQLLPSFPMRPRGPQQAKHSNQYLNFPKMFLFQIRVLYEVWTLGDVILLPWSLNKYDIP